MKSSQTLSILHLPSQDRATRTKPVYPGSKILDLIKSAQTDFSLLGFFHTNKFSLLSLFFATPVLIGSTAVVSFAAPPEIAQVVVGGGNINRPTLKLGSQGERVSELQGALKLLGYYTGTVDGNFSQPTANAVSQFKQAAGLTADGIVDGNTWQRLFPGDGTVATASETNPNKFPTPTVTPNTTISPTPDPKPSNPRTVTSTSQNSVRQSSDDGTSTTRSEQSIRTTSTNRTGQTTRTQQSVRSEQTSNSGQTPRTRQASNSGQTPRTRQTSNSGQTPRTRQASNSGQTQTRQASNSGQTPRTRQTSNSGQTPQTKKTPSIQYTAAGMPILRVGMRGSEVVKLQERLKRLGFLDGDADGDFGTSTEAAVKTAQQRYGLEADGVAGGATWDVIMRRRPQAR